MTEENTEEKKEAAPPKPTKFGAQILAAAAQLKADGLDASYAELSNFLGKAVTLISKSAAKLEKDGYVKLTAGETEDRTLVEVLEQGEEVAEKTEVERKKKENENTYIFKSKPEKGPPQMMGILEALESFPEGTASHDALMERIGEKITTRQAPSRVFQFYRPRMLEGGYIEVRN